MDKPFRSLAKGSFFLLLQNMSNLIMGAIFWVILAKFIEPASLGYAMVAVAFALSIIGFLGLGINITISKFIGESNARREYATRAIYKGGNKLGLISATIATTALILSSSFIAENIYNNERLLPLFIIVSLFIPPQIFLSILRGTYEGNQETKYTLYTEVIFQIVRVGIAVTLVLVGFKEVGIILAFIISSLIAYTIGYINFLPKVLPKVLHKDSNNSIRIGSLIRFAGMNYLNSGLKVLSTQIGVIFVGIQNIEWAAFYGLSILIGNVIGGTVQALARALTPTASAEYINDKLTYAKLLNISLRVSLSLSGFLLLLMVLESTTILGLIGRGYIEASSALTILAVASILNAIAFVINSMLNAANRERSVGVIGLISYSTAIILTPILVATNNLEGAALAILIGSILASSLSSVMLYKFERIRVSLKVIGRPIGAIITTSLIILLIKRSIDIDNYTTIIIIIALYCGLLFAYKAVTINAINKVIASIRGRKDE